MAINKEFESAKNWYINNYKEFSAGLNGLSKSFFTPLRENAIKDLGKLGFPTTKNEEWRYTNISPLLKNNFIPAAASREISLHFEDIKNKLFTGFEHHLLVFINGIFSEELSSVSNIPSGVIVDSFGKLLRNNPEVIEKYIDNFNNVQTAFDALNTAYTTDGLVVIVPDGKVIDKPVQALYLNGDDENNVLISPRNLVIVGKNSHASVVTVYEPGAEQKYFTNITTNIFVDENGNLDLYKIQNESEDSYHIEKVDAVQNKQSVFSHYNILFGGGLVRNDINTAMNDEFIETNYYGLYLGNNKQHIDNHTFVDHAMPNCVSNELYKGILDDKAHGVFNGKIMVRKDAQKTNAYQSNKTVLLSKEATIDTKPQLEIFADDVKCSHGATIGHLDDEAYFYIRSRGIPAELAKSILIRAFANDVVEKIKIDGLKEQINHLIFEHLHRIEI
ncbi:MAG: Fe-S cluster assembly protein SufD [Melioribacteraceae bacterium]|nr:Fe-S cluster assembly protein SufD [Melioribacteraceae bacterium]